MKWGFDTLISLEDFKERSIGYLFNDSCVFGAEVSAVPVYTQKDRCLSMIKPPETMNTYTWTVDKFSAVKEEEVISEVFKIGNVKWTLSLYPKKKSVLNTYLEIYLTVHEAASFPDGWRVYAKYELRVKNQFGYADQALGTKHWFCKSSSGFGFPHVMQISELYDMSNDFLVNDRLIVEAKISVIGMLRNFI